jgi:hypothetical protein
MCTCISLIVIAASPGATTLMATLGAPRHSWRRRWSTCTWAVETTPHPPQPLRCRFPSAPRSLGRSAVGLTRSRRIRRREGRLFQF